MPVVSINRADRNAVFSRRCGKEVGGVGARSASP